jgi:hypothetical protein
MFLSFDRVLVHPVRPASAVLPPGFRSFTSGGETNSWDTRPVADGGIADGGFEENRASAGGLIRNPQSRKIVGL